MSHSGRSPWPHTAAILAGGSSTRMGRPKEHLVLRDGRTMIEAVADALTQVTTRIVVLGSTTALAPYPHLPDLRPDHGPLGGIEALLASGLDHEYIVCPCDLPRVTSTILQALTRRSDAAATVLRIEGEAAPRPLPARFSAGALAAVRAQLDEGRRAVHAVLDRITLDVIDAPGEWIDHLINVNTPDDLSAVEAEG